MKVSSSRIGRLLSGATMVCRIQGIRQPIVCGMAVRLPAREKDERIRHKTSDIRERWWFPLRIADEGGVAAKFRALQFADTQTRRKRRSYCLALTLSDKGCSKKLE